MGLGPNWEPYKYEATQNEKGKSQAHQKRDLGSLGFIFIFLFFSFLFSFLFFFYFRRFRADYFLVFLLSLYFLDLGVIVELKLNAEINFFSNYYLECIEKEKYPD